MSDNNEKFMFKGDSRTFRITVTDSNGSVVNITDGDMTFTMKSIATDIVPILQKKSTVPGEIVFVDPTHGIAEIYILPDDTESLTAKSYVFDVEFITSTDKVYTVYVGTLTLQQDVTN